MRTFGGFCLLLLLWSASAMGRDIFVDNIAGDDRSTGQKVQNAQDQTGPVRTITKALQLAAGSDTIVLAKTDQPYRESISLVGSRASGLAQRPFTIRGNGAILDGSAPVPASAWQNFDGPVFRFRPPQIGCQQLFLDNRPAVRVISNRASSAPSELKPKQWCSHEGQVYFCVELKKLPADYHLTYAHLQTGITLFHVDRVLISDLTVQGFRLDGINLQNSARHVSLVCVTCRGNGRGGVAVGGASLVDIDRSLLGDNGQAQLLTLPSSETFVRNSHLLSNTAPGWVDQGGRVYLDDKRLEGGLDEFHPAANAEKKP